MNGYRLSVISCRFLAFAYLLCISCVAFSKDSNIIRVEAMGTATVTIDTTEPNNLARDDAFKKAVAKVVDSLLPKGTSDTSALILDDKIYSNAANYIVNYRVFSKETMEDETPLSEGGVSIYTIYLEADIAVDLLTKDLIEAGILHEKEVKSVLFTIVNPRKYKIFELFKKNIKGLKGVKEIHYKSFAIDKIELVVETTEDVRTLKKELMSMNIKGWKIEATVSSGWFSADRIEIRFLPF